MSPRSREFRAITVEEFAALVHDVLGHLYDSAYLRNHRISGVLLSEEDRSSTNHIQKLRRAMLEAIESLRPEAGVPADSPDWNAYHILELRYIEGLSPGEVMTQLAVSRSKFFQDQARALAGLTALLWERRQDREDDVMMPLDDTARARINLIQSESQSLQASAAGETLNLIEVLEDLRAMVIPLASSHGVRVSFATTAAPASVHANRVVLRQALLGLLTYAVKISGDGEVAAECYAEKGEAGLRVHTRTGGGQASPGNGLSVCAELASSMDGRFWLEDREPPDWEATLALPAALTRGVLLVDDNQGLIELFRRYLAGQDWQVLSAESGRRALEIARDFPPTVIVLDVMMPDEDGWETLMSLKGAPETQDIPVVICSVVNEPDLARSLGAAASLTKPVTQEALLSALAPWR